VQETDRRNRERRSCERELNDEEERQDAMLP
jgi:hypothetical protein